MGGSHKNVKFAVACSTVLKNIRYMSVKNVKVNIFLEYGHAESANNRAERHLRPIAIKKRISSQSRN